jgi:hypothetical protein
MYQTAPRVSQNMGVMYKKQPDNVKTFLFFYKLSMTQSSITSEAENIPSYSVLTGQWSHNSFRDTGHHTPILANAEYFNSVHVGFEHKMCYWLDC